MTGRLRYLAPVVATMLVLVACSSPSSSGGGTGGYAFQGPNGALNTQFGNGGDCLFTDPPGCYLHHQASFMAGPTGFFEVNFPPDSDTPAVSGETYDFFPMPAIDFSGITTSADGSDPFFETL
jgi:hypothetical protein